MNRCALYGDLIEILNGYKIRLRFVIPGPGSLRTKVFGFFISETFEIDSAKFNN